MTEQLKIGVWYHEMGKVGFSGSLRMTADNVLVILDKEEVSPGGIVLVQSDKPKEREKQYAKATVMAVGPGTSKYAVDVLPGDRVVLPMLAGDLVRAGIDTVSDLGCDIGTELRIVRESEIIGLVD